MRLLAAVCADKLVDVKTVEKVRLQLPTCKLDDWFGCFLVLNDMICILPVKAEQMAN